MSEATQAFARGAKKLALNLLIQILVVPAIFLGFLGMAYLGVPFGALHIMLLVLVVCLMIPSLVKLVRRKKQHGR